MPREGVSYEAVAAAAEALQAAGGKAHVRAVREQLGGTGSPNTIHRHLVQWRATQPLARAEAELPEVLLTGIREEIARREQLCAARIEERFKDSLQELTELCETVEREGERLKETLGTLQRERDTLSGKATEQAETLTRQERLLETLRTEETHATLELEQERHTREQYENTIRELKDSLGSAQTEARTLHEALHKKEQQQTEALCELAALKKAESVWTEDLKSLRAKDLVLTTELKTLGTRLELLNGTLLDKAERLARTEGELKLAQQAQEYAEEKLLHENDALQQQRSIAAALETENQRLRDLLKNSQVL